MTDNITLPRKHIDYAAHALEHFNKDAPDPLVSEIIHHLRTALAAPRLEVTVDPRLTAEEAAAISAAIDARKKEQSEDVEALRRDAERYRKQKERSYRLQRLLKECVKVMQANAVFRDTKAHKDLKTRIRAELEDKR